jgi:hypothetical protein
MEARISRNGVKETFRNIRLAAAALAPAPGHPYYNARR